MDTAIIATTVLGAVTPYLLEVANGAAKEFGSGAGKTIWEWVKAKLSSPAGQETTADLEKSPTDQDNVKAFEAALSKVLKADPVALGELESLLERAGVTGGAQTALISGSQNITTQASGADIQVSITQANSKTP